MAPEIHQRVRQLFDQAMERPEAQRKAFVDDATVGDPTLREAVEGLLRSHGSSEPALENTVQDAGQIGRYVIRGELGRGAMGIVCDAVDPMIGRRVAVKIISLNAGVEARQAEFMKERLFREARSAGRLFHPGIVVILDVGLHGDSAFITMEHIEGGSLHQLLASGGPLAPDVAISILKQTAAALYYAHQFGVVHRDIKPANIMLQGGVTVKVADFGVAKLLSAQNQTLTGVLMGTPSYMSPEQIEARPVDGRSDQFSLAVLAYELLTGVRPFVGESMATVAHLIVYGPRPSARAANAALAPGADGVLERALSRFPDQRFPNCTEFAVALEKGLQNAKQPQPANATKKRASRSFLYVGGAMALVIVALIFAAGHNKKPPPSQPVAKSSPPALPSKLTQVAAPKPVPSTSAPESVTPVPVVPVPVVPVPVVPVPVVAKSKLIPAATRAQQLYKSAIEKRGLGKPEEARTLFQQAAELGDVGAMEELAENYSTGPEALQWFKRAAAAGNSTAMVQLGAMYSLGGDTVPQSDEEAARWYQRAADLKNPAAMYDLAGLYETGQGVARDVNKARQLYQASAALGNLEAQRRLTELGAQK
jgi:serine/threonine protein kinase